MASYKIKNRILLFLLFSFLLVTLSAQDAFSTESNTNITGKEKAVIAFFKLDNQAPDYEYWIKESPLYQTTSTELQEDLFIKEWLRLGNGYGLYETSNDTLEITATVIAKYIEPTETEPARFTFSFPNHKPGTTPIFSYPYGNQWVSMVINRLSAFTNIPLTNEQYQAIKEKLPGDDDNYEVQLTIHVHPSQADHSTPTKMYGQVHWIMIGEIAYIQCSAPSPDSGTLNTLWDYVAPWYEEEFRLKNMPEEEKYPHPYDLFKK